MALPEQYTLAVPSEMIEAMDMGEIGAALAQTDNSGRGRRPREKS